MKGSTPPLPPLLVEALASGSLLDDAGVTHSLDSSVSAWDVETLIEQVRAVAPRVSAEVGLALGISTVAILHAIGPGAVHHVIDPYQDSHWANLGLSFVRRNGLEERMRFHEAFPEEVIPGLPELEFAFIDGSHLFDYTMSEFVLVDRKLRVGGRVAFHDIWMPSIRAVIRYVLLNRAYSLVSRPSTPRGGWRRLRERIRGRLAGRDWFRERLSGDLLMPLPMKKMGNTVVLRKDGADRRDWRHHVPF
ncbi:MAG TPA: class I SAM-dependent methyltransferase [Anaeromyxobacter sp.]|nr:class I SAM-dependent methyltransferase [Anaeromyxobacter sp.]